MNKDELLLPRYKVIAPWPGMHVEPFNLHQIVTLQPHKDDEGICFIYIPVKHVPGSYMRLAFFALYPHLFKKLQWYEDRKPEEMPEYLEWDNGVVCKPTKYLGDYFYLDDDENFGYHLKHVSIATREEYEAYQKKTMAK